MRVGLLGGSFNPIHVGHLALGRAAAEALALDRLIVMPTGNSWQKAGTKHAQIDAAHRLAMVQIALAPLQAAPIELVPPQAVPIAVSQPQAAPRSACRWAADDLEVSRAGPSYTVDSLRTLRERLGPAPALILVLGSDQLHNLATWHRWQELPDHAHLAVTQRERVALAGLPGPVERMVAQRGAQALPDTPAGSVVFFQMPPVAVSATGIREQLTRGECPEELLPPGVFDYIRRHHLYRN